ncbi:MAG: hypothetical protein WAM43_00255 [Terriglobales bacterium]
MSKTRSNEASKPGAKGAARKGSSSRLKVGDRVRIVDISADLKDPNFDLKNAEHREMRTAELFRFCLGREFVIQEFDPYGHAELQVGEDRGVRRKFGRSHSIWMEPEFLERIEPIKGPGKRKTN